MTSLWRFLVFDIEANGFKPDTLFCIGITDAETLEHEMFYGDDIVKALIRLEEAELVIGHAIRTYDCPVLENLTDGLLDFQDDQKLDTLDMSRALRRGQPKHGLEYWGDAIGYPKGKQPLFEKFDPEMLPYCSRDVLITVHVFFILVEEYLALPKDKRPSFRNSAAIEKFITAISAR